jgi:hypothetical protein
MKKEVARMVDIRSRSAYRILVGNSEGVHLEGPGIGEMNLLK